MNERCVFELGYKTNGNLNIKVSYENKINNIK